MAKSGQMSDAQKRSSEIDAILNRHRVNLAQHQKLVESWFPLSPEEREQNAHKVEPEVTNMETMLRPELAGVGADLSKSSRLGPNGLPTGGDAELEKLRKQMLGRKATASGVKTNIPNTNNSTQAQPQAHQQSKRPNSDVQDGTDSDDEGRASSFKSKRSKKVQPRPAVEAAAHDEQRPEVIAVNEDTVANELPRQNSDDVPDIRLAESSEEASATVNGSRASFMDQIIAERKKKKKKKKRKNKE